jgi:hypothetical protein
MPACHPDTNGTTAISDTFLFSLITLPKSIPEIDNRTLTLQLGKLDLVTPFQIEMQLLNATAVAGGLSSQ